MITGIAGPHKPDPRALAGHRAKASPPVRDRRFVGVKILAGGGNGLDGTDIVYINRVHRHRISSITLAVGTRLPAHATSAGHVLLADLMPEALSDYFNSAILSPLTDRTLTTRPFLTERLEIVRRRGWDAVDQELEIGRRSAAAPTRGPSGSVIAALSFSCGTSERSFEKMLEECLPPLLQTAEQISTALGAGSYSSQKKCSGLKNW
jgi:IclR family pca regulon transcriptional regulator